MSRIRRIAPGLGRGGLLGNTEGPEAYLRELDTLPSQFCRATGGTETVISQGGKFYRVHTFTDTDPTSLLLNFDGANGSTTFTDDSGWGHAVTANGDAEISTTESVFGGSSAYFDGTGDYLSVAANSAFAFGTGDFTIEFWLHTLASSAMSIVDQWVQSVGSYATGQWQLFKNADDTVSIYITTGASTYTQLQSATTLSTGVFYHLAVVRSGGTIKLYFNGAEDANTLAYANAIGISGSPVKIGVQSNNNSAPFNGYIDSLRITKGAALYTSAFTPPTQALTRVGSGSLTFTRGGSVEYLVVGGGGGGGTGRGGGGGAGGYRTGAMQLIQSTISVGVGGGGAADSNGSNSDFSAITSSGGGHGSPLNSSSSPAGDGGSGGGGALNTTTFASHPVGSGNTPPTVPSQGNDGGLCQVGGESYGGGGGGGANEAGGVGTAGNNPAGAGGDGIQSSISGSATYYAGGGGGGTYAFPSPYDNRTGGAGGLGGGGNGGYRGEAGGPNVAAIAGTANTGGGGGGGGNINPGASGGSGIVIARYRITQAEYEAEAA